MNREVRARKTPQIAFLPDEVLSSALRVEEILRGIDPGAPDSPEASADGEGA